MGRSPRIPTPLPKGVIGLEECADRWGVHPVTVRRWRKRFPKDLTADVYGNRLGFRVSVVKAFEDKYLEGAA